MANLYMVWCTESDGVWTTEQQYLVDAHEMGEAIAEVFRVRKAKCQSSDHVEAQHIGPTMVDLVRHALSGTPWILIEGIPRVLSDYESPRQYRVVKPRGQSVSGGSDAEAEDDQERDP